MADFETEIAGLMRGPAQETERQDLVEAIMDRVEADSRRRTWLVGAFATGGAVVTAAILAKAASLGVSAIVVTIPKVNLPASVDPLYYTVVAALAVMAGGSILTIRLSRAL